ncbi:hypothetical protein HBN50_05925 [Halobacteriovorax sp. GB3]|uniref:hypothetical protein n=1 Tax=Halobacteriovorax sp. GB3 TaxID=2719615 RepID=UPI0023630EB4|nr:hypothetical protein [Halobacteriovorax sp. GB3]MDD0852624.1 hypothetical protein [Halobacteriovorax sp. GB3]
MTNIKNLITFLILIMITSCHPLMGKLEGSWYDEDGLLKFKVQNGKAYVHSRNTIEVYESYEINDYRNLIIFNDGPSGMSLRKYFSSLNNNQIEYLDGLGKVKTLVKRD